MGVTPNYAFVICLVKKLLSEFAGSFECDHHIMRIKRFFLYVMTWDGNGASNLSGITSGTFNALLNKEIEIESSDSSVTITIDKQNI